MSFVRTAHPDQDDEEVAPLTVPVERSALCAAAALVLT